MKISKFTKVLFFIGVVALLVAIVNLKSFTVVSKDAVDSIKEGYTSYSEDMFIETKFPMVMDKFAEYQTTRKYRGITVGKETSDYYAIPVYVDEDGIYHFAALKCNSDGEKEKAKKLSDKLYDDFASGNYTETDSWEYSFEGRTVKMDSEVKKYLIEWMEQTGYDAVCGTDNFSAYIEPVVFVSANKGRTIALQIVLYVVIAGVVGLIVAEQIVVRKKQKEAVAFSAPVQQSQYADADDFFKDDDMNGGSGVASTPKSALDSISNESVNNSASTYTSLENAFGKEETANTTGSSYTSTIGSGYTSTIGSAIPDSYGSSGDTFTIGSSYTGTTSDSFSSSSDNEANNMF